MLQLIIEYLNIFLLLLLAGAITICGFFAVTRGNWREEIDGTMIKDGAAMKWWWFFWFKEYDAKIRTYYKGQWFTEMVKVYIIKPTLMAKGEPIIIRHNMEGSIIPLSEVDTIAVIEMGSYDELVTRIEKELGVKVHAWREDTAGVDTGVVKMKFYREDPSYVFPDWLRTMMAGCVTCFSSFYGSLIYWFTTMIFFRGFHDTYSEITGGHPWVLILVTWFAYMLSLAYLNTALYTRMKKM